MIRMVSSLVMCTSRSKLVHLWLLAFSSAVIASIADSVHQVAGPLFWAFGVFKNCAGLTPWKSTHHKGEGIAFDGC